MTRSDFNYLAHELNEHVAGLLQLKQASFAASPELLAVEAAHGTAFHRGLGSNIAEVPFDKYVSVDALSEFAKDAFVKPNVALVSSGPSSEELSKWVGEFFKSLPAQGKALETAASTYHGGEARIASKSSSIVIAFPGSSAFGSAGYKPELSVLAALLGGQSTIKWTPGFSLLAKATESLPGVQASTKNLAYSDAGLFTITLSGDAAKLGYAGKGAVDSLKKIAAGEIPSEEVKKATALAKFQALETAQNVESGLEVSAAALLSGTKLPDAADIALAIDSVSAEQVKNVSLANQASKRSIVAYFTFLFFSRLPSPWSRPRPLLPVLAIFSAFRTRLILV